MSSGATKGPSSKGGASSNKGGTTNSKLANSNPPKGGKSSNKSDSASKPEKTDLIPKMQPTAEQIQIAKIMDTHRAEDPDLQKKIRQVMEVARTTEDQAAMALHSKEYDIEQAITLLTEGGGQSLEAEWAQAGKKRKQKSAQKTDNAAAKDKGIGKDSERAGGDRVEKRDRDKPDKKEGEAGDGQTESRRGERGGRGATRRGGRGGGRGGRSDSGKENEETGGSRGGYGGRSTNGVGRGGRGGQNRGRGGGGNGRMFSSRTRGRGEDYSGPIEVWENSQAESAAEPTPLKVDNWNEFPPTEDWDNEEYTGSLADTKVFTPSTQTAPGGSVPLTDATNVGGSGPPPSNHLSNSTSGTGNASEVLSKMGQGPNQADGVTGGSVVGGVTMSSVVAGLNNVGGSGGGVGGSAVVPGQSIDISMLLQQKTSTNSNTSTGVNNRGADLLASLQQNSYSNSNQALPQRQKVQRPRGPQTSKIPASAVEMPDNSVTTLDVQFGGLDFGSDSTVTFNSVMHGKPTNESLLYGSASANMDTFSAPSGTDKDGVQLKTGSSVPDSSPFQNQRTSQVSQPPSLSETKSNIPNNSSPNLDSHSMTSLNQSQPKNQPSGPSSYGAAVNAGSTTGSAFVSYGKGAPGFPAPGFQAGVPPVGGAYNSSAAGAAGVPVAPSTYGAQQPTMPTQVGQPGYHAMNSITAYGTQATVPTGVQSNQQQGQQPQTAMAAVSQTQVQASNPAGYGNSAAPPPSNYHHSANSGNTNSSGYASNSGGSSQYGSYGSKMQNTLSGSGSVKDTNDSSLNATTSSAGGVPISSAQLNSGVQPGSVIAASTATSSAKMATVSNSMANNTATSKMGGIPPGMMMQPQGYILGQAGTVPAFYSVQAPVYGFEDNSVQFVPRISHQFPSYYDASGAGFGTGVPGAPGVSGRSDGAAIQAYSTAADGRFQRSDSSTASPVPSNLPGGNTQQTMYNAPVPGYYFLGNNAVVHGTPYPFAAAPPHHMYQTAPMAAATNASGAPHAPASNHQYQNKSVYSGASYTAYDGSQSGPSNDFVGKNSYSGGFGVGPNSNSGKGGSGTTPGVSQSTDLNSSINAKGHMNKMNSYDKQGYGTSTGGGYTSMGATQGMGSQLGGGGMPPYGIFVAQQPVQTLPMHQESGNVSRQGGGQPKGGKQQYNTGPYWGN